MKNDRDIKPRRMVAIVGRPNVTKSTLFNRLIGRRQSIVHPERGVTRDRLIGQATWGDQAFAVMDTGGVINIDRGTLEDSIEAGVRRQVDAGIRESAVVLVVVDVTTGLVPLDEEVIQLVRGCGRPVMIVANKADTAEWERQAVEFERFGYPVMAVSAQHGLGMDIVLDRVVPLLPKEDPVTVAGEIRVAVVGRPNVGKSSYINRLLHSDRVLVSPVPGTTRDSVEIPFVLGTGENARRYRLMDTAGLRHQTKVDSAVERFSQYRAEHSIESADVVMLVLDAEQGPTAQDKKIASIIQEHRKGCVLLVNKWDLIKTGRREYEEALHRALPFMTYCPVVFVSAKTGEHVRQSLDTMDQVAIQINRKLTTSSINQTLEHAVNKVSPPSVGGRRLKLFYGTQTGQAPIRIQIFVNNRRLVQPAYREYLVKAFRAAFHLEGAPVILVFKSRREDES